ncbi:MAG: nucleotide exchange factor GrpE [Eubacteriales bacterium]
MKEVENQVTQEETILETQEENVDAVEEMVESNDVEESQEENTNKEEEGETKGKKAKKSRSDKKQDKAKEQITELEDKVKRQMAEFDNFRKRSDKEKAMMFDMGAKNIVEKILPVVDNFERGLQSIAEEEKGSFYEGMEMIYKQMLGSLEEMGVKTIEAVGVEFNPEYHNAVMQVESEEYEAGIVAQELQKGYQYNETVIRHSMVAVVQ